MSNFKSYTRHPYTGEFSMATWLDDHYGPHRYGVKFPNGDTFSPDEQELTVKDFDERMYEAYCEWHKKHEKEIDEQRESGKLVLNDKAYFDLGLEYFKLRESYNS